MKKSTINSWPSFSYSNFKSTGYLLHRGVQAIGKLKLNTPFEPHWSNVALWLTCYGFTTGPIAYKEILFSVELNFIEHRVRVITSEGLEADFALRSMSVAKFTELLFARLEKLEIFLNINLMPQEVENPIAFDKDTVEQMYNPTLANTWWKIQLKSYVVMQHYHSHFTGNSPPIGLMWGTFDLRDARYNGISVPTTGPNADFIRRNAMNEAQIEIGWWPGNEAYPCPAYYSFVFPQPEGIERIRIKPEGAHWDSSLSEFILDYDCLLQSKQPEKDLLKFFESTYKAETQLALWDSKFITKGRPI